MSLRFITPVLCLALLAGCESARVTLQPINNPVPHYGSDTFDLSAVQTQPIPRYRQPPLYPFALRRAGLSGEAMIDFVVDIDGSVTNAVAIKATDARFADAAQEAIKRWKFRPAEIDGRPVRCHMQVPIVFTLNDELPGSEPPKEARRVSNDEAVYDAVDLDTKPIPQYRQPPRYPVVMRQAGIKGEAIVDFVVTTDGTTANVHADKATAEPFADAAVSCVQHWRFRPGLKNGIPVNCHMQVPIVFTLNNG